MDPHDLNSEVEDTPCLFDKVPGQSAHGMSELANKAGVALGRGG